MPISETFANSVVPDQMPQNGFRSGSTLFAFTEISIQDNVTVKDFTGHKCSKTCHSGHLLSQRILIIPQVLAWLSCTMKT